MKTRQILFALIGITIIGIVLLIVLFLASEHTMEKDNGFIRRFPDKATEVRKIDLTYNSYYFAGEGDGKIYLGNYTSPLTMTILDAKLAVKQVSNIKLDHMDLPFHSVQVRVEPPNVYIVDNTIPVVFKGNSKSWKASLQWKGTTPLLHYQILDSTHFAYSFIDSATGESSLATLYFGSKPTIQTNKNLLQKQIDGLFDVDGEMHYDKVSNQLVYLYHYRNQYIVTDNNLKLQYLGNTIDTNTTAKIEVAYLKSKNQKKLSTPPLAVNKGSYVYHNLLFVKSGLAGRYEPKDMWDVASVIDVYNRTDTTYVASFYVYHIGKEKLESFFVIGKRFYAFIGTHLVEYQLGDTIIKEYKNLQ